MLYDNNKINNIISMEQIPVLHHRDDTASRIGMWLFIFTEIFLFAGLFLVFIVYRFKYFDEGVGIK